MRGLIKSTKLGVMVLMPLNSPYIVSLQSRGQDSFQLDSSSRSLSSWFVAMHHTFTAIQYPLLGRVCHCWVQQKLGKLNTPQVQFLATPVRAGKAHCLNKWRATFRQHRHFWARWTNGLMPQKVALHMCYTNKGRWWCSWGQVDVKRETGLGSGSYARTQPVPQAV